MIEVPPFISAYKAAFRQFHHGVLATIAVLERLETRAPAEQTLLDGLKAAVAEYDKTKAKETPPS